jgi:hypothetical protein
LRYKKLDGSKNLLKTFLNTKKDDLSNPIKLFSSIGSVFDLINNNYHSKLKYLINQHMLKSKLKVSILDIIYNTERKIEKCLEEVIQLTPKNDAIRPCTHIKNLTEGVNLKFYIGL